MIIYCFLSPGHIQVSQVPHRNEPDTLGEINYPYIFHLLKDIGYAGWIGCEYVPSKGGFPLLTLRFVLYWRKICSKSNFYYTYHYHVLLQR